MSVMDPEERFDRIERQQEFLAASQAQHAARMAELEDLVLRIGRIVEVQAGHMDTFSEQMNALAGRMDTLAWRMDQLAEAQARTDERLNALILVVERYFSNGGDHRN